MYKKIKDTESFSREVYEKQKLKNKQTLIVNHSSIWLN